MTTTTEIHALELGPMENFIYLIEDRATGRAAVVDPAWDADAILALAKSKGLTITDILLTHSHHDHINAIDAVLTEFDAELHLTQAESQFWGAALAQPRLHHGGDSLQLGDTDIKVLHTPGHTPGSACYHIGDELITGDTMFVFGCGRCDLAGGDPNVMFDTLRKIRTNLPAQTIIRPGHNYAVQSSSTLSQEIDGNPFLHFHQAEDFVHFRMDLHGKVRSAPYSAVTPKQAREYLS